MLLGFINLSLLNVTYSHLIHTVLYLLVHTPHHIQLEKRLVHLVPEKTGAG